MKRLVVLAAVFLLSACAGGGKRVAELPEARAKALRREVTASLAERDAALRGLRGLATVRYGSKLLGVKGETAFALRRPGDLRVDALSDFGAFASQVILTKGRLQILWPADGKYFLGPADRGAMERFLRIGLDPEEVVDLFLGLVPIVREDGGRAAEKGKDEVVLRDEASELTVRRVDGRFVPSRYVERDATGRVRYEVRYSDFALHGGQIVPEALRADFRDPSSRVEIRFKEIELNPKLGQNVFSQKIPDDAEPLDP